MKCFFWIGFELHFNVVNLLHDLYPLDQSTNRDRLSFFRAKTAILRDERIKIMNEVICGMRVIKMYAWEYPFSKLVCNVRRYIFYNETVVMFIVFLTISLMRV